MVTSFTYGFRDPSEAGLCNEFLNEPVMFDLNEFYQAYIRDNKNLDYEYADVIIRQGFLSYVKTGMTLHWMRMHLGVKFLEQYCQQTLKISKGYANQIIKASRVTWELIQAGFRDLPLCIAQALPLAQFLPEDSKFGIIDSQLDTMIDKWDEVIDTAKETFGGKITAKLVSMVCNGQKDKPEKLSTPIDSDNYKKLVNEALDRGMSVKDLLNEILNERYAQDDVVENTTNEFSIDDITEDIEQSVQVETSEVTTIIKPESSKKDFCLVSFIDAAFNYAIAKQWEKYQQSKAKNQSKGDTG